MASRKKQPGPVIPPDLTPSRALEILRQRLVVGESLEKQPIVDYEGFRQWRSTTVEFIGRAFGSGSSNVTRFNSAGDPMIWSGSEDQSYYDQMRRDSLEGKLSILRSCLEQLEVEAEHPQVLTRTTLASSKVFLVHGRNDGVRETVARFLEKLSLPVTILHEQPNKGRTIIEKFEDHASEVGFAVVLLTGDDKGGLATDSPDTLKPRARQNVVFELGFFSAKVGRDRVCALYEPGVELPSDYAGVLFIELDSKRRWEIELGRELRAAGFDVNLNRL